uniref:Uncharacterized protein n=1 Tax=Caenorhabditis tropicalis TaxID=1561998 RepID=A0A1I7UQW6_9PELO
MFNSTWNCRSQPLSETLTVLNTVLRRESKRLTRRWNLRRGLRKDFFIRNESTSNNVVWTMTSSSQPTL